MNNDLHKILTETVVLGTRKNWWGAETLKEFLEKTKCMDRQYSAYRIKELGVNVNGSETLDENIADNAGAKIGYNAYGNTVKIKKYIILFY